MEPSYFTTNDLKERYKIRATRTLKEWRKKRGFPEPIKLARGSSALYPIKDVLAWEQEQLNQNRAA